VPSQPPTPEQVGFPPDDLWWQQDPEPSPVRPYNPQSPPKYDIGPMEPGYSDPNSPYDPVFNLNGYT
jgi:hypothetical protein